jgi:hypothetical protein
MSDFLWGLFWFLFGSVFSIVLAPKLTRLFDGWIENQSLGYRKKSLSRLRAEYHRIISLKQNSQTLYLGYLLDILFGVGIAIGCSFIAAIGTLLVYTAWSAEPNALILSDLVSLMLGSLMRAISPFDSLFVTLVLTLAVYGYRIRASRLITELKRLINFSKYESRTLARIAELEKKTVDEVRRSLNSGEA